MSDSVAKFLVEKGLPAFIRPSLRNYELLANNPAASAQGAYTWIFLAAILAGTISNLSGEPWIDISGQGFSFGGAFLGALIMVALFVFVILVIHGLSKIMGGQGTYGKLAYTSAAFYAPFILLSAVVNLLPVTIVSWLLGMALMVYVCVLTVIAVRAVHQLNIFRALLASSPVIGINALLIIAVIVFSSFNATGY